MPLPTSLHSADLTFDCPSCSHALVKSSRWFQTIGRFKCNGCQRQVRLTYADKLALFARHVAVQSPVTNDVTELVHNKKAAWPPVVLPSRQPAGPWLVTWWEFRGRMPMKVALLLPCIALAACDGRESARPPNGSIAGGLQRGMTEQQVSQASSDRVPDRVIMKTCGTETPKPFACKVYVYDGALRTGQYDRKLSVVFEDVRGHWIVSQWL